MAKLPDNILIRHRYRSFSQQRRTNLINAIQDCLEEGCTDSGKDLNEKEAGFLEDMSKDLSCGKNITTRQYDWLTDLVGFDFLQ
jgi:hypothetical protein